MVGRRVLGPAQRMGTNMSVLSTEQTKAAEEYLGHQLFFVDQDDNVRHLLTRKLTGLQMVTTGLRVSSAYIVGTYGDRTPIR